MPTCQDCGRSFSSRGIGAHVDKCKDALRRITTALPQARVFKEQNRASAQDGVYRTYNVLGRGYMMTTMQPRSNLTNPTTPYQTHPSASLPSLPTFLVHTTTQPHESSSVGISNDATAFPGVTHSTRPRRSTRRPAKFKDVLPTALRSMYMEISTDDETSVNPNQERDAEDVEANADAEGHADCPQTSMNDSYATPIVSPKFTSLPNAFGLKRVYEGHGPSSDAEPTKTLRDFELKESLNTNPSELDYWPYPNFSMFALAEYHTAVMTNKTKSDLRRLTTLLTDPSFRTIDLTSASWDSIEKKRQMAELTTPFASSASWKECSISIDVPITSLKSNSAHFISYKVPGFHHKSLVGVIRSSLENKSSSAGFVYEPYTLVWDKRHLKMGGSEDTVYGELYTSKIFCEEHARLQKLPSQPDCNLPRAIAALMFWSDGTSLSHFGSASLWPLYLFYGNQSKTERAKPSSGLCHHIAFFPSLPDDFKDFYKEQTGKNVTSHLYTHCRREVLHSAWDLLLDHEFVTAYEKGTIIDCADGIRRRVYPRIFTYSADYPEKAMLGTIRDKGLCPCPRCLILKDEIQNIGTPSDAHIRQSRMRVDDEHRRNNVAAARKKIYGEGYALASRISVEPLLKDSSFVPTLNAFSRKLSQFGFDFHTMLVVDLLHEVELGVGKSLFTHALRLILAYKPEALDELDHRFRAIPPFGRDTIRQFSNNVSSMKGFAARDFEDVLQCAYAPFEGLLPEPHNGIFLHVIYTLVYWHGLAKLRLHTGLSLRLLEAVTVEVGASLRKFRDITCSAFRTTELPREAEARARREAKRKARNPNGETSESGRKRSNPEVPATRHLKHFSLRTYKLHALGDYARFIRQYGTTDSYSTQTGELEHRTVKHRYARTNKVDYTRQIARIERRQETLRNIRARLSECSNNDAKPADKHADLTDLACHYHIARKSQHSENLDRFLQLNRYDPALQSFRLKLKSHLLERLFRDGRTPSPGTFSPADQAAITIENERLHFHFILKINYTSYDVQRSQDIIHVSRSRCHIMVFNPEYHSKLEQSCYLYARVIKLFHVNAVYCPETASQNKVCERRDVALVRWFEPVGTPGTFTMEKVSFIPHTQQSAFGFIDPADIIRAAHVVPVFSDGFTENPLQFSLGNNGGVLPEYKCYYVNKFADRDMLMRFHPPLAVGHSLLYKSTLPIDETAQDETLGCLDPRTESLGQVDPHEAWPAVTASHTMSNIGEVLKSIPADSVHTIVDDMDEDDDEDKLDSDSDDEGCSLDDDFEAFDDWNYDEGPPDVYDTGYAAP